MTAEERLQQLRFNGIQGVGPGRVPLALVTDAETGSTFALVPGETMAEALARFAATWAAVRARGR